MKLNKKLQINLLLVCAVVLVGYLVINRYQQPEVTTPQQTTEEIEIPPSINTPELPTDSHQISKIPTYIEDMTFQANALPVGSKAPDFTLHNLEGEPVNLQTVLNQGKPVVLISGSYTCHIFRANVENMRKIHNLFADKINMYVVYVVEPHPITDISPYAAEEWLTDANVEDKIFYRQPTTYGERKTIAREMLQNMETLTIPVILDDADNNFWLKYGEAPTRAYVLKPDGTIYLSQGWFESYPLTASISALLTELQYEAQSI